MVQCRERGAAARPPGRARERRTAASVAGEALGAGRERGAARGGELKITHAVHNTT